ncbi:putative bifunctional diguanylate cyclase/phosphodiesterase [Zavarzinia aquatilis]|uniref:PAS domain S-box protein n=1 Tax=Zavarzinia aquatilis TaxID=2211142 RepID=A0A317E0C2_9PROT|nr:EAL domain-containing protein [Zavarzinia aquatilis]PWR19550.1 PAS domain S-box protein [Zavarzinia aquatilis]
MAERSPVFQIAASAESFETLLDALPAPIFVMGRDHGIVIANAAVCQFFGVSREALLEKGDAAVLGEQQRSTVRQVNDRVFDTGQPIDNEEVVPNGRGGLRVVRTSKRLVHLDTASGRQPFIVAYILDITEVRETEANARYRAEHDDLTGLLNRGQFLSRLSAATGEAADTGKLGALLMLDVDGFAAINDLHGSILGDEFLRNLARRLTGLVRSSDVLARIDGDCFGIIVSELRRLTDVDRLAERVLSAIGAPLTLGGHEFSPSVSIGAAIFPVDASTVEGLVRRAENAMLRSRRTKRHAYLRADGTSPEEIRSGEHLARDMREALGRNEFYLAFQAQVDARTGETTGFEALARWHHPEQGPISPEIFIGLAEATGFIHELGRWVLIEACRKAKAWPWPLRVAVNVSPVQLESPDFPLSVEAALAESGLPVERLEIEVTESALLGNTEQVVLAIDRLKALGVAIALDDFGTGWSSLATLQRFRFDRLKIDRTFVERMEYDTRSLAIVRAVLNLGYALDVPVTAEGVEQLGQLVALRQMGCTEIQGFLLGRPEVEATLVTMAPWNARSVAGMEDGRGGGASGTPASVRPSGRSGGAEA